MNFTFYIKFYLPIKSGKSKKFSFSIRNVCMYVKTMSFTRQGVNLFTFDI